MSFSRLLGWQRAKRPSHPRLRLRIFTNESDYEALKMKYVKIAPFHTDVVTDSGAQSCVWSLRSFLRAGFKECDLIPVSHKMKAANKVPIKIEGAIILHFSGEDDSCDRHKCAAMVYVSSEIDELFLSENAMKQLAIIPVDFPVLEPRR